MIPLSIIIFAVGCFMLLFGKYEEPIWDILGFMFVVGSYVMLLIYIYILV